MPKRQKLTPFQHELLARERDQARIEHNREVEQTIFRLAKQSERDRQQIKALQRASVAALQQAINNKQVLRQLPEPNPPLKSDSQSDDEAESVSETNSQHSEEYVLQPFGYQELVLGISIGFAIGLYFDSLFGNQ
jgi:uncharacterized membrane protein YgaE (UPF0421/DUF939 family)